MNAKFYLILVVFSCRLFTGYGQEVVVESSNFNLANEFYEQAVTAFESEKYSLAVIKFSRAIKYNPNNSDYFFGRASAYYELVNYDSARVDISRAIEMEEGQPDYHYRAGNICFRAKQYEDAYRHYSLALENLANADVQINAANCRYNRGISALYMEQYNEAILDFTEVFKEDPEMKDALYNRGVAYKNLKDFNSACEDFTSALEAGIYKAKVHIEKICK